MFWQYFTYLRTVSPSKNRRLMWCSVVHMREVTRPHVDSSSAPTQCRCTTSSVVHTQHDCTATPAMYFSSAVSRCGVMLYSATQVVVSTQTDKLAVRAHFQRGTAPGTETSMASSATAVNVQHLRMLHDVHMPHVTSTYNCASLCSAITYCSVENRSLSGNCLDCRYCCTVTVHAACAACGAKLSSSSRAAPRAVAVQ
eukprot:21044-Heterococcus_DN1.PRE.2